MMFDSHLLAYIGVTLFLTMTPGADTMLTIRNVMTWGRESALPTIIGIMTGLFVHATMSALGVSLILAESARAFAIVKVLGAAYLVFLGMQSLYAAWKARGQAAENISDAEEPPARVAWRKAFLSGFMSNVLNPKVAVFYLAILPQFISHGEKVLLKSWLLAGIHGVEGFLWLSMIAWSVARVRGAIMPPKARRIVQSVAGLSLIGFGVKLAVER
jgi:threonine/homoserine/homoserine lactone efflux protein